MAPGQFFFINSENLGKHSVGIDTAFATMGYLLAHFSLVLVQPMAHVLVEECQDQPLSKVKTFNRSGVSRAVL